MDDRPSFAPLLPTRHGDDLSGHLHRQTIGIMGMCLPVLLVFMDRRRPTEGLRPENLDSISAFYYSAGVVAFVGVLASLAVFLFTYRGYDNAQHRLDKAAALIAGTAAVLLVSFPARPPVEALRPTWWTEQMGWIHNSSAVVLFAAFIAFALLFLKSDRKVSLKSEKGVRNLIYILCALGMVGSTVWSVSAGLRDGSIFWPETIALELFAFSWLVKGQVDRTVLGILQRTAYYARHPGQLIRAWRRPARDTTMPSS